ncbi:MAG: Tat pathway signal protein [Oceanicaulis sp.]|uniref:Acg family FMN-binding oxidoreductase n=2 Tax=Oceanicaulis TaxID=153232 RepID=UPI0003B59770|nr:nitroreductase family protein [Oceanicaulis alexandrii]MAP49246.1 Tat pathway signal protein [Oceanicaulis sp.]VXC66021.1 Tat pathway signal protein [Oceanicaulis sp. 350]HCR67248.1 Tat pathway signal protein [Oceanicaulis sp.]|tara:strand:- start:192 stop:1316 length:1125 start_codon:yes stop_codon:yes gene_type:complete
MRTGLSGSTRTITRRQSFAAGALVLGGAATACSSGDEGYDALAEALSAPAEPVTAPFPRSHQQLVRYASLAASGHNTQPWRFTVSDPVIELSPDFSRRTPVVDPDDHHLFASLGCAAENLSLAARASGLGGEVDMEGERLSVALASGAAEASPRFDVIPQRQCTRLEYAGSALSAEERARLIAAVEQGGQVSATVFDGAADKTRLTELIIQGNSAQIADPAFVRELRDWIRFNEAEAARLRDGLFAASSGNPQLPGWLGRRLFGLVFTADAENAKIARQIESSGGLIALMAEENSPRGWMEAGRAAQRLQLEATVLGLKTAYLNQPVEVASLRPELAALMGAPGRRPNLLLRVGRGPAAPRSLRRSVEAVIEPA